MGSSGQLRGSAGAQPTPSSDVPREAEIGPTFFFLLLGGTDGLPGARIALANLSLCASPKQVNHQRDGGACAWMRVCVFVCVLTDKPVGHGRPAVSPPPPLPTSATTRTSLRITTPYSVLIIITTLISGLCG